MAQTWSVGYNTVVNETVGDENIIWSDNVSFPGGMRILLKHALIGADNADDPDGYFTLIEDILDIHNDPGIMDDPDMWEDLDFDGPDETTWFIVEN